MSRVLTHDVEQFTDEELALMASNGVTGDQVREFIRTSGPQTLETAIGGIHTIQEGRGQERNEPFSPQAAPEMGSTDTNGVVSTPLPEFNGENLVAPASSEEKSV